MRGSSDEDMAEAVSNQIVVTISEDLIYQKGTGITARMTSASSFCRDCRIIKTHEQPTDTAKSNSIIILFVS